MPNPNIVLTGFMGVGKTAVGREVARRLGRTFVDMDDLIVLEAGMSIPEIFETRGEAYFRELESAVLRQLAAQNDLVIATGGGALVDPANRELMTRTSLVICLSASVSAIEERLSGDETRPLLAAADRRQRIVDLINQRAAAYAEIPYRIDTTNRAIGEVADEVIALAQRGLGGVLKLPVSTPGGGGYDILVGRSLLRETPALLAERGLAGMVAVVSDENVTAHWADPLLEALAQGGYHTHLITLPAGEQYKNLASIGRIYDELVAAGMDRQGVIAALGGGVVGDMAGFAAATYLRGVHFVQIPTSLLAMVDASVGGKTGVDLPQGKNLVGAFKWPDLVIVDPDLLNTLPAEEFRNGLAEVVKHGILGDRELFGQLYGEGPESLESMLARALRVKIRVVENDPYEQGERAHLNLGHTFAHAIEQVSGYAVPHGQAVGLGLIAAAELAAAREDCSPETARLVRAVVERLGLPTHIANLDADAIYAAMSADKKRRGKRLRFVLPHEIGRVAVHDDVTREEAIEAIKTILQ
ncbi:MAG: 3-dehydroquinate synthase [Chloroflexi bacterium]|nr:3-dehydroquinate synthase [Chloroflexota bacterium]